MIKNKLFILGLTILTAAVFNTARAQSVKNLKLDNKLSILNDKAYFNFPTAAKNEARETDIMSADHNINQETRIVLDVGTMKLVFFAQELYLLGDNNLPAQMAKEPNKLNFTHKTLTDKDGLLSVLSTPAIFDSTKGAILINSLMVKTKDNSIFRISAYINPDAYKLKNEFITLSEEVFKTLTNGSRKNNLSARQESLNIFGTKKEFKFSLPQNYCITIDQKYDFQVFKLHKYINYSDTNWVSLTIYTGDHPSYFHREYGFKEGSAKNVDGTFLKDKVEWLWFNNAEQQTYLKEQKIPSDKIAKGLIVHVAMLSNQAALIDELSKIVEGIELK